jgi:hypothetical protein
MAVARIGRTGTERLRRMVEKRFRRESRGFLVHRAGSCDAPASVPVPGLARKGGAGRAPGLTSGHDATRLPADIEEDFHTV